MCELKPIGSSQHTSIILSRLRERGGKKETGNLIYKLPDRFLLQPKAIMHLQSSAPPQSFHMLPLHRGGGGGVSTKGIFFVTSEDTVSIIPGYGSVEDFIP